MNGAGKSSLLDAITWAVWGTARTRSDDDLIHLGQNEMQVSLDFEQDGLLYRVIRKRKAGKARKSGGRAPGTSTLDFFAWDGERACSHSLMSRPFGRRRSALTPFYALDYDVFVNSAFLQQGKADAFTTKTPAQRKDILSDILGLDRWARYEEQARNRLREVQQKVEVLRLTKSKTGSGTSRANPSWSRNLKPPSSVFRTSRKM